jgi:hypothetical protein
MSKNNKSSDTKQQPAKPVHPSRNGKILNEDLAYDRSPRTVTNTMPAPRNPDQNGGGSKKTGE